MSTSLASLVNNLSDVLYNDECTNCKSCHEYISAKDNPLIFNCLKCNKNHNKEFNKDLIKRFVSTYEFCDKDIKFILLLKKGVYPYEYMNTWERFDETLLLNKEVFYRSLNMEDIADVDYRHLQKVFKIFKNKNIGDYHDLYVQSDILLLGGVFENFRNKCIEIYEINPAHFLSPPRLAWQAFLKKIEIKLEFFTDIDMLLMVEKGITGGMCHAIHRYAEANNRFMKSYDKNKESSYIQYLDANNLYGWAISQKLLVDGFKWIKDTSSIDKNIVNL